MVGAGSRWALWDVGKGLCFILNVVLKKQTTIVVFLAEVIIRFAFLKDRSATNYFYELESPFKFFILLPIK